MPTRTLPHPETADEVHAVMAAEAQGAAFLLTRDGRGLQRLFGLRAPGPLSIGRHSDNAVALAWDAQVSRVHATLEWHGGEWALADDGLSRNGTWVNGARVSGRARLRDRDSLRCGQTALAFRAPAEASAERTVPGEGLLAVPPLNDTQRRVLEVLCRPYRQSPGFAVPATNQEISDTLYLSLDAVKTHLRVLFAKFGLQDLSRSEKRARLAEAALHAGLGTPRTP